MRIVITSATVGEWMPCFADIPALYTGNSRRMQVRFHQSGVGMLASAVSITRMATEEKPDLIIQVGIAGSFRPKSKLGSVVAIEDEWLGDMGVEEDGKWKDIFDLKLERSNYPPFEKKRLPNPWIKQYNLLKLPIVTGITVNEITTHPKRIEQLKKKYDPYTESMEGAALHYVCREAGIPFIQFRAISNYVGERDKSKWQMTQAIHALNAFLLQYIDALYKIK